MGLNLQSVASSTARELFANGKWAIRRSMSIVPGHCIGVIATSFVNSLIPAAIALSSGALVRELDASAELDESTYPRIGLWLGLVILIFCVRGVSSTLRGFFGQHLNEEVHWGLSCDLLEHSAQLGLDFFEDPDSQDMLSMATRRPGPNCSGFLLRTIDSIGALIKVASLLWILVLIEPWLTAVLMLAGAPLLGIELRMAGRHHIVQALNARKRRWTQYYLSLFTNHVFVASSRILNLLPLMMDRFQTTREEILSSLRRLYRAQLFWRLFALVLYLVASAVVLIGMGSRARSEAIAWSDLTTFAVAALFLQGTLDALFKAIASMTEHSLFLKASIAYLQRPASINEHQGKSPSPVRGDIELEGVTFAYPGGGSVVLDKITLRIRAGETVAIVGHNGSGKTSLAKLLARFYDVDKGRILIDGIDIREWSPRYLHSQIAMVFQQPIRYEATASDNIAFGDWSKLLNHPRSIRRAAAEADVDQMIRLLPEGYETHLGRLFGQATFSGGQWQRLALARALARQARILIMDEPAVNLDVQSEVEFVNSVLRSRHDRTTIIISHRFFTIRRVDRIFVLEEGRLVEQGTQDELMAQDGLYAHLYRLHTGLVRADERREETCGTGDRPEVAISRSRGKL